MHIVVFPGWYPDRIDKLSGDFIQRHLQAISLGCRVTVIRPVKQHGLKKAETEIIKSGNLEEQYYYYPSRSSMQLADAFLSFISYNLLSVKAVRAASKIEKISLVHLYVLQKNLAVGLICKWLYKIDYVISEQSTFYVDGSLEASSYLYKRLLKMVFEQSGSFHAVSAHLLKSIKSKLLLTKEGIIIPNTVDTGLFNYNKHPPGHTTTFVHVSNMVYQKNVEGMLAAFAEVKKVTENFKLNLAGPLPPSVHSFIHRLGLAAQVVIWNQVSYSQVAAIMQQSDAFVFFTRFETFGCVIIEANACGLPVIVSELEVTKELITDGVNGLYVESDNIPDLKDKILYMTEHADEFDRETIALQTQKKFGYREVSWQFTNWYKSVIGQ